MALTGMYSDLLPILASIAVGAAAVYAGLHLLVLAGLLRRSSQTTGKPERMSVIVAARNEAQRIGLLLESLTRQVRPPDEIIVVDDRSDDGTADVVANYRHRLPVLNCVRVDSLPDGAAPKKHALERGIASSTGSILCFTDADSSAPPAWLRTIERSMARGVGVVVGYYVPYSEGSARTILRRFIEYEKYKTAVLSAGSIGLGFAWTASGSNLAYRRAVYDEVGGFAGQHRSISGDDDLFVQRVRRQTSWKIVAMPSAEATVLSEVPPSWTEFYRQRARHLSAGRWYDAWSQGWLAVYHGTNALASFALLAAVVWPEHRFLTAYVIKVCADLFLCALGDLRLRRPQAWTWFLPLELVNTAYVLTAGPLGWLTRVRWKGSTYPR